ncbi:hypothetical protein EV401DRAFT_1891265 [Pisolithus croceorrhizus]|nr:hypothetical protein EV401DRAFT_1891265 [Pisolithus croceorrhizus]
MTSGQMEDEWSGQLLSHVWFKSPEESSWQDHILLKAPLDNGRVSAYRLEPSIGHNSCYEADPPLLLKKCETLGGRSLDETWKTQHDVKTISQTLGIGLLEHIHAFFLDASEDYQCQLLRFLAPISLGRPSQLGTLLSKAGQFCPVLARTNRSSTPSSLRYGWYHFSMLSSVASGHYRQVDVHSAVQEIIALQMKLHATQDDDEQQALEEDVMGKARPSIGS